MRLKVSVLSQGQEACSQKGVGEGRGKDSQENDRGQLILENKAPRSGGWLVDDTLGRPSPPQRPQPCPEVGSSGGFVNVGRNPGGSLRALGHHCYPPLSRLLGGDEATAGLSESWLEDRQEAPLGSVQTSTSGPPGPRSLRWEVKGTRHAWAGIPRGLHVFSASIMKSIDLRVLSSLPSPCWSSNWLFALHQLGCEEGQGLERGRVADACSVRTSSQSGFWEGHGVCLQPPVGLSLCPVGRAAGGHPEGPLLWRGELGGRRG